MQVKESTEQKPGKRYKLTVRSAEEAVRVIREKLGENAKVISVRQVGGDGLRRFISSPKLEVVAEIREAQDVKASEENEPVQPDPASVDENNLIKGEEDFNPSPTSHRPSAKQLEVPGTTNDTLSLLQKTGFDQELLNEIQSWTNWENIKSLSLAETLKNITVGLSDRYRANEFKDLSNRIALLGSPGVGKTTTLCKFLAHEVFMNKTSPMVLKVENGVPNPDDALRIFCEVVGVTLYREKGVIPATDKNSPLFIDFPGLPLNNPSEWSTTNSTLDELGIETRVLVLNGAYDKEILKKNIQTANHLGATHLAITHFDEIANSTKLWPLILRSSLSPLCICNGQNVTGDFSTSVLNQLIARTFPEELYSRGFASYKQL